MSARHPLEQALDHRFSRPELLELALIHRSYASEHPERRSNERLEFLGDAVLQLVVTEYVFAGYPDMAEGDMAKVRAAVVSAPILADKADVLNLGAHLQLGKGEEQTGGRDKESILADTMEAVLGALYLDGGYGPARDLILRLWVDDIDERARRPGVRDYKTRLQEMLAVTGQRPHYAMTDRGPDHDKTFTATVEVDGFVLGRGVGNSKKRAEQEAAREALERLGGS